MSLEGMISERHAFLRLEHVEDFCSTRASELGKEGGLEGNTEEGWRGRGTEGRTEGQPPLAGGTGGHSNVLCNAFIANGIIRLLRKDVPMHFYLPLFSAPSNRRDEWPDLGLPEGRRANHAPPPPRPSQSPPCFPGEPRAFVELVLHALASEAVPSSTSTTTSPSTPPPRPLPSPRACCRGRCCLSVPMPPIPPLLLSSCLLSLPSLSSLQQLSTLDIKKNTSRKH